MRSHDEREEATVVGQTPQQRGVAKRRDQGRELVALRYVDHERPASAVTPTGEEADLRVSSHAVQEQVDEIRRADALHEVGRLEKAGGTDEPAPLELRRDFLGSS